MFFHNGRVSKDSEDERAFMALNISMTTRMERDIVEADLAESSLNMAQPISGKAVEQRWKLHYGNC